MMGLSAVGERQRAWDRRCSSLASRIELIDSMVEQGDWKFSIEIYCYTISVNFEDFIYYMHIDFINFFLHFFNRITSCTD